MPLYKGQQVELEMKMGINLDGATCYITVTPIATPTVHTDYSASRVGQTGNVKRIFTGLDTANFSGRYGFQPKADFGSNNVVPGKTIFLEFGEYGT